jgi:hypothetical protein
MTWPAAFAWTVAIELPLYALLVGRRFRRWWTVCLLALGLNVATHPALWFVMPRFEPYWLWVLVAEACVVAVETLLLALALRRARAPTPLALAFVAALVANAASTAAGLWLLK